MDSRLRIITHTKRYSHDPDQAHLAVTPAVKRLIAAVQMRTYQGESQSGKGEPRCNIQGINKQMFQQLHQKDGLSLPTDTIVERINDIPLCSAEECGSKRKPRGQVKAPMVSRPQIHCPPDQRVLWAVEASTEGSQSPPGS